MRTLGELTGRTATISGVTAWTLVLAGAAMAQPGQVPAQPKPVADKSVSELVVTASKLVSELTVTAPIKCIRPKMSAGRMINRPKIVSAFPEKGAVVRPGLLVLRITFDRPMACDGEFLANPPLQNPCEGFVPDMLLSGDRRTIREVCVVAPSTHFGASANPKSAFSQSAPFLPFMSDSGMPADGYDFDFKTSSGTPVSETCEALAEDGATYSRIADCARHGS